MSISCSRSAADIFITRGAWYTHAFLVVSIGVCSEWPVLPIETAAPTTPPTSRSGRPTQRRRRRKRGDASLPVLASLCGLRYWSPCECTNGTERGTHEFTSHFPLILSSSIMNIAAFTFDFGFGSSATSISAVFGYE